MKTNYWAGLAFVCSVFFVGDVHSDVISSGKITSYGTNDYEAYFEVAEHSDWVFGSFKQSGKGNDKDTHSFVVANEATGQWVSGTLSVIANGNSGFNYTPAGGEGYVSLSHNVARVTSMSFNDIVGNFVNSFYFTLAAHDNSNDSYIWVTAKDSNGNTETFSQKASYGMFYGFTVDEGYFTEFNITVANAKGQSKNNGGYVNLFVGLGDSGKDHIVPPNDPDAGGSSVVTPEPATLLIFGLGLTGAFLARRRMSK